MTNEGLHVAAQQMPKQEAQTPKKKVELDIEAMQSTHKNKKKIYSKPLDAAD
jgi:hypothetical protein